MREIEEDRCYPVVDVATTCGLRSETAEQQQGPSACITMRVPPLGAVRCTACAAPPSSPE